MFILTAQEDLPDVAAPATFEHFDEEELISMIRQLPTGYRSVFNMFAVDGYSHKEIAEKLGITESTSKSQLNRARNLLKKMIMNSELNNTQQHG